MCLARLGFDRALMAVPQDNLNRDVLVLSINSARPWFTSGGVIIGFISCTLHGTAPRHMMTLLTSNGIVPSRDVYGDKTSF